MHRLLSLLAFLPLFQITAQDLPLRNPANQSLRNEVAIAIEKGLAYLRDHQQADGSWGEKDPVYPAMTAFPLIAFHNDPKGASRKETPALFQKGYAFLRGHAKPDGGIYDEDLPTVNTALSMMALLGPNDPKDAQLLAKANEFLVKLQNKNSAIAQFDGGFSYGPGEEDRQWADLHNTVCALEALRAYESVEKPKDKDQGLNWDAAIQFVTKCQNLTSHNKEPWVSDDPENKGGFVYNPISSTAGDKEVPGRRKLLISYGSMSYAGVLCLVYSGLDGSDPRLTAALDWLGHNFSVEDNPKLGKQGLFLYYNLMANALATSNVDTLTSSEGKKIDWAKDLAVKLVSTQKGDGTWLNENGRWMENDPVLVTSYTVIALEMIYRRL